MNVEKSEAGRDWRKHIQAHKSRIQSLGKEMSFMCLRKEGRKPGWWETSKMRDRDTVRSERGRKKNLWGLQILGVSY